MSAPDAARELVELRRCVRDLAALAALPVVWSSGKSTRVVESLADALLGILRLDFVYIRYSASAGAKDMEVGRLAGRPSANTESRSLGTLLQPWLSGARAPDALPPLPGCNPELRGHVVTFGLDGATGLIASGSARTTYPTETEHLLLRVAASQAAVILAREQAESQRERLLLEVEAERKSLSQVFERAPSFMCLLRGPDHVIVRANEHYRRLVGDRELLRKPLREALPEVASQGFLELLDRVFRTGETYAGYDVPVKLRTGDGEFEERYVDFTYQAMRGADGNVAGVLVQGVDLTERKRAASELRTKDARLQLLMNNLKDYAVVITDPQGKVTEWAGGAERITGYAAAEAIGQPVDLLFTEDDLHAGQPERERGMARETGKAEDARWHRRRDGRSFFADGLTAPLYDDSRGLQGFGKIFRDATLEWQARQRLARVAEASRSMIAVLSVDAILGVLTEEARDIIGAQAAAAVLETGEERSAGLTTGMASGESRPGTGAVAVPLVGHASRKLGVVRVTGKLDGEFTAEDEAILQQLAATAAVGIENAQLYDSLKEQDRRKDDFLAILAHELRNPLAPVRTGLELLRHMESNAKAARDTRDMMGRQIAHMVRLIDDLMDVSRISRDKLTLAFEDLHLGAVIDAALEATRPAIQQAKLAFRADIANPDVRVRGDLTRLAQVLGNLLNNAAKYTPAGGSIVLESECVDGSIFVRITDTGVGIAAETLPRIFELFTQEGRSLGRAQGGLGIGLALARKLVEMHGGSLEASSRGEGRGSTFTVRLPVVAQQGLESVPDPVTPESELRNRGALRVMVVDDNVDAAQTFALLLGMAGHETVIAHTGPHALELAGGFRPNVVFLDIGLPGMNGYDVARELRGRSETAAATLVALTGWGSEADRARARQAGFDHHLTKPVEVMSAHSILAQVALEAAGKTASV